MWKWIYIKWYKPTYKLVCGTVEIFYCFRLTRVKVVSGCLFVPIRYHKSNMQESVAPLMDKIRQIAANKIKSSYKG